MMCYRCEHRARFLEDNTICPRVECGQIETSKAACYMFLPSSPLVFKKMDEDDPRPWPATGIFAARSQSVKLYSMGALVAKTVDDGVILVWDTPDHAPSEGTLVT